MTVNTMNPTDDILQHFSKEASPLIRSYLLSLEDTIAKYDIDPTQKTTVFNGIYSYIDEFIEEKSIPISFADTMKLLDQLGSPTEILHSLNLQDGHDVPVAKPTGVIITPTDGFYGRFKQGIIDHPYSSGIFGSYLVLIALNLLWELYRNTDQSMSAILRSSFLPFIIPALVLGIIFGIVVSRIYRDDASFEVKYKNLSEEYEETPVLAMIFTYVISGPLFGGIAVVVSEYNSDIMAFFGISFAILASTLPFVLAATVGEGPKPEEVSYLSLLRFKSRYHEFTRLRFRQQIWKVTIPIAIVMIIWNILFPMALPGAGVVVQILSTGLVGGFVGLYFVNYAVMYAYSWKSIIADLQKFEAGLL